MKRDIIEKIKYILSEENNIYRYDLNDAAEYRYDLLIEKLAQQAVDIFDNLF